MAPLFALAFKLLPYMSAVPEVIDALKSGSAEEAAGKVVEVAKKVSGIQDPEAAATSIINRPELQLEFQKALIAERVRFAELRVEEKKNEAAADNEATRALTERMALLEGTASDLKSMPYVGPLMLFMRGMQRLVISYGTAWLDYLWLTGGLGVITTMQERLLFTASLLVFVVLFGERAIKNVAPVISQLMAAKK